MRVLNRMILIALFACMVPSGLKAAQKDGSWATDLKAGASLILSNSPKPEEVNRGLTLLFDTANKIAVRDSRLPAEFRNRLQAATKAFTRNPLGAESSEALNGAYKILNGGKNYTFPNEIRDIGDAGRIARQYIDRSVKALESGESDQAARDILACILLVTTPMMK